jgi:sodium-coupled neutral amino acid transporter 11
MKVTGGIVSLITGLALVLEDAGVVVSLNGAVMGSAIIFIFPSLLFLKSSKEKLDSGALELTTKVRLERIMSRFLVCFGAVGSVVGGAVTIITKYFPNLLR